jgi:2,3-diaminopropionate biosynthesis protein SbnA
MELDKIISSRQRPLSLLGEEEPADARGPLSPPPQVTDGLRTGSGRVCDGVLEAIGQTPLIRLRRYLPHARFHLYAKLEALNPGGSIKDRPAFEILDSALRAGEIGPETVIVESSSGNMGIGLAQACRYHGIRFICVVDPKTTPANLATLKALGAEIDFVQNPDPVSGEFLQARIQRVRELLALIPGAFWTNQYANQENSGAHYRTTMRELIDALDGRIDFLLVPTSTCGTVRGCSELVQDAGLDTRIIAVDAIGSQIFSDVKAKRTIPGLGAGLRPPLCDPALIHECVHVDDLDCVRGCRRLAAREAILAGGSSGGVLAAVDKLQDRIPSGAVCAAILPDRGERYLTTIYSDDWVREHCGDDALTGLLD